MKVDIRDINPESFYQDFEEPCIDVCCDENKSLCAICEENEAKILVSYERTFDGLKKSFKERVCFGCYSAPDFQELMSEYDNVKITLL